MSFVKCTNCGTSLKTASPPAPGKKLKCPKCAKVFVVEEEKEQEKAAAEEENTGADHEGSEKETPKPKRPMKAAKEDDEDDQEGDKEEETPRPKKRAKGDEAGHNGKQTSKKLPAEPTKGRSMVLVLGGVGVVLLLAVCAGVGGWFFFLRGPKWEKLDLDQLADEKKGDVESMKALQKKYAGKQVEVTGKVGSFSINAFGKETVTLHGSSQKAHIAVEPKQKEIWALVSRGQLVTVRGKIKNDLVLFVGDAEFVDLPKNEALAINSTELAAEFARDEKQAGEKYKGKPVILTGELVRADVKIGAKVFLKGDGPILLECDTYHLKHPVIAAKPGMQVRLYGIVTELEAKKGSAERILKVSSAMPIGDPIGQGKETEAKDKDAKDKNDKDKNPKDPDKGVKENQAPKGKAYDVEKSIASARSAEQELLAQYRQNPPKKPQPGAVSYVTSLGLTPELLAFSPADPVLVAVARKTAGWVVARWDLKTRQRTHEVMIPEQTITKRAALTFSPNGEYVASVLQGPNRLRIYKAGDLSEVKTLDLEKTVVSVAFSDDTSRLSVVLGGFGGIREIKSWTTADWQEAKVDIKTEKNQTLAFSPDGRHVLAFFSGRIDHLDLATGAKVAVDKYIMDPKVHLPSAPVTVSPDGRKVAYRVLAATGKMSLRFLDLDNVKTTTQVDETNQFFSNSFSPDGRFIYFMVDGNQGQFKIISVADKQAHTVQSNGFGTTAAFSAGGLFFAIPRPNSIVLFAVDDILSGKK